MGVGGVGGIGNTKGAVGSVVVGRLGSVGIAEGAGGEGEGEGEDKGAGDGILSKPRGFPCGCTRKGGCMPTALFTSILAGATDATYAAATLTAAAACFAALSLPLPGAVSFAYISLSF